MRSVKYAAISTLAFALAATAAPVDGGSNQVAAAVSPQQAGFTIPSGVSGPVDKAVGTATNTVSKVDLPQLTPEQQQTLKPVFDAIESLKATAAKDPKTSADIGKALKTIHDQTKKIVGTANDRQIVASIFSQVIEALVSPKIVSPGAASHAKRDGEEHDLIDMLFANHIIKFLFEGNISPSDILHDIKSLIESGNLNLATVVDGLSSPNRLAHKVFDIIDQAFVTLEKRIPLLEKVTGTVGHDAAAVNLFLHYLREDLREIEHGLLGGGLLDGALPGALHTKRDDGNLVDDLLDDITGSGQGGVPNLSDLLKGSNSDQLLGGLIGDAPAPR
ncbi:hypothetical protein H4219_006322 [Mycoemilia scoparia]|uniref:Secreted protein n=1 Tax=Mycoemilia scoparia TaxID=417184 RepID=A0A9W7ZT61_9FUNG|nr:hypothetical protein H4219_006322 [Mycoemilia scoparia]